MKAHTLLLLAFFFAHFGVAKTIYVSSERGSNGDGTIGKPFKTISEAANVALAGDTVLIHGGVYREWVSPANSGMGMLNPVVYMAAPGEKVFLKGSEVVGNWRKEKDCVWSVRIPNTMFGDFNPYAICLFGDWLHNGKELHLGEVYVDGIPLSENPDGDLKDSNTWTCNVEDDYTIIKANFGKNNPNKKLVEINVRPACFFPKSTGVNYITIKGLNVSQAATQWAAPTNEQIGAVGPNWSKGWVIEDCEIHHSKCVGLSLGKPKASGHNLWSLYAGKRCYNKHGFTREIETIFKASRQGWNKENVGSHIIRNNIIHDCGQAGIVGHLGSVFSNIYKNEIFNISMTGGRITGFETAGIKLHAAIDAKIEKNLVYNSCMGLWLDWQAQGTHVCGNVFFDNVQQDFFIEVSHGPTLVYNNVFLSPLNLNCVAQGIAFFNNLFVGKLFSSSSQPRYTPYHEPHSTEVKGLFNNTGGDIRFYNNIFYPNTEKSKKGEFGLKSFDNNPVMSDSLFFKDVLTDLLKVRLPMVARNNIYFDGSKLYKGETDATRLDSKNKQPVIVRKDDGIYLRMPYSEKELKSTAGVPVSTESLGVTIISEALFENNNGSRFILSNDLTGRIRNVDSPMVGPFETVGREIKLWEK